MRLCFAICALWPMWIALGNAGDPKIVCYYYSRAMKKTGVWKMDISDIDPTLCTHLVLMDVGINEDGNVRLLYPYSSLPKEKVKANFQALNALRKINPGLKTLVAIGDEYEASATYLKIGSDNTLRRKYAENVVNFLRRYKLDGFSIDWLDSHDRRDNPDDVWNFALLLEELRRSFDEHKFILSAMVQGNPADTDPFYDIFEISKYLHIINLIVSINRADDQYANHISPLYPAARETTESTRRNNLNWTVNHWLSQGAPPEKIILGVLLEGFSFVLKNSAEHVPGSPSSGFDQGNPWYNEGGYQNYNEICNLTSQDSWTTAWDKEQRASYAYSGNQWISFDNVRSVTEEAEYAKSMGLGGVVIRTIDRDDHQGNCGDRFPILNALNRVLRSTPSSGMKSSSESGGNVPTTSKPDAIGDSDEDARKKCVSFNYKYVRDSHNCAKFWICVKTKENELNAQPFWCGNGLHFDTDKKACKSKNSVECS